MRFGRRAELDRALSGRARTADVRGLVASLREDRSLRSAYDRGALAMRTLERAAVAEVEIDWVERWLEADGTLGGEAPHASPSRWWWIAGAVLAAGAVVVGLRPVPQPLDHDDPLHPKGLTTDPQAGWLALSVLCDGGGGADAPLVDVSSGACPADASIGFAVRVDARHHGGDQLVLFGVDANGDVQYYLPTPEQPAPTLTGQGAWVSLDRAVRLAVNHPLGRVRVYAALVPHAPTIDAIDDAAAVLARVADDERPWLERLGPGHALVADCVFGRCVGAELEFRIEAKGP